EVEAALDRHPSIAQCSVNVQELDGGQKQLVAFVVASDGGIQGQELRKFLADKLPDYMVPSLFVPLESMPLTPSGKVDRRALLSADYAGLAMEEGTTFVAPSTITEAILADIWEDVLATGPIGVEQDFFDVGGNSLYATQVISRIRKRLGVDLPVRTLFEARTIALLAKHIKLLPRNEAEGLAITRATLPDKIPLSPAQHRLWLVDRVSAANSAYNMPMAVWVNGGLHQHSLDAALRELVRRHETLRTTVRVESDLPYQVVHDPGSFTLKWVDLSSLTRSQAYDTALLLARQKAARPFDLEAGPLFRTALINLSSDRSLFTANVHHIVSDGWSLNVLTLEVASLFQAMLDGLPSPLAELPIQYADYSLWQSQHLAGIPLENGLRYWRRHLAGSPLELPLPTDHARPATQSYEGATRSFDLNASLATAIFDLARRENVTTLVTMLAGFAALLARYSGESDLVIGTPVSGRNLVETEPLIGFFVNTLPLRFKINRDATFVNLIGQAKEIVLSATAHQDIPFEMIVDELQPERHASRSSIFQVMFTVDSGNRAKAGLPGLDLDFINVESETSKFDLTLALGENVEGISGTLQFSTDLFDSATIQRMSVHYRELLRSATSFPSSSVFDLALLSTAEAHMLCVEENDTSQDYPYTDSVHDLFNVQCEASPDRVAVVYEESQFTYLHLRRKAAALARRLNALGAHADIPVGLCVSRSPEAIIGLLAILQSGAAYLPLDPDYPEQRLAAIMKDCGAWIVLADRGEMPRFETSELAVTPLDFDGDDEGGARGISSGPVDPDSLAYIVYTSGSTGKPKGIAIPHRAVVRLIINANYVSLTPIDVVAQVSTISFDAATFEIWGALLSGGRLVITGKGTALSPSSFGQFAQQHQLTTLFLTTALFNEMVRERPESLSGINQVLFGGEAVDSRRVARYLGAKGRGRLLHVYGPTETTTYATWHLVRESDPDSGAIPIGRPISNTTVHLLDDHLQSVPLGVSGELYIG
ncbi:MAG TPA: condensation domain-containing protein, partial [Blastocatellia bacterium]|nr:condensation domain-containing protein [Blastocatellia bacterium]